MNVPVADELDAVVIGAGVIGLAVARALALAGREVVVLEAEPSFGTHTSSRNSEVVHAGIYYPTGSLKARLCVAGKHALYAYAEANEVPHARLGKIVVATRDEEIPALEKLLVQAAANGVNDLSWLDRSEIAELEPDVRAVRGLLSPSTGIVSSHDLMASFRREAVERGAHFAFSTPVLAGKLGADGMELSLGGAEPTTVRCRTLVNAAGLHAPDLSRTLVGLREANVPRAHYAKGHYYVLSGRSPFRRLVYPLPIPGGLGVHVTLDLGMRARFGPDVSWVEGIDYRFDESRERDFYAAIRAYYPGLPQGSLEPGYTGIRPKLGPAGGAFQDFVIEGPAQHGFTGFVALYGIESPGLTASLAIADEVVSLVA
jgi:L-2-hydroxyglutarate oxidase LhgO